MFHVVLILIPLIFAVIFGSIVLFGAVSIIAGIVGSASIALLVKDKTVKYLLLLGFSILLFVGSLCVLPLIAISMNIEYNLFITICMIVLAFIGLLALSGIYLVKLHQNKTLQTVLMAVFIVVIILALICMGFVFYFYQ
jgi:hypothetical protein